MQMFLNWTNLLAAGAVLACIGSPALASEFFPRALHGRWSTDSSSCGTAATLRVKGDTFSLGQHQCSKYRTVCMPSLFRNKNIKPGDDCTVVVNCSGSMSHGLFDFRLSD